MNARSLRRYLKERQKELLKEDGNVVIRIGKYEMITEILGLMRERVEASNRK